VTVTAREREVGRAACKRGVEPNQIESRQRKEAPRIALRRESGGLCIEKGKRETGNGRNGANDANPDGASPNGARPDVANPNGAGPESASPNDAGPNGANDASQDCANGASQAVIPGGGPQAGCHPERQRGI